MKYFAYGSNLPSKRLKSEKRVPTAIFYKRGKVSEYKLCWHKRSKDESGKANAFFTGNPEDIVEGVIWEINDGDDRKLDKVEGAGYGYHKESIKVETEDGLVECITYLADDSCIDGTLKPYTWYKCHVIEGAHEHSLPADYVAVLKEVEAIEDSDKEREKEELKIYDCS